MRTSCEQKKLLSARFYIILSWMSMVSALEKDVDDCMEIYLWRGFYFARWFSISTFYSFPTYILSFKMLSYFTIVVVDNWATTWDFQQHGMCDQQRLRPAWAYAQSYQSHYWSLEYSMTVKLLSEQHLEFLSLTGGCTGSSESIQVKMPHCWKSHVVAHYCYW